MSYSSIVVTVPSAIIASVLLNEIGIIFWIFLAVILLMYLVNVVFIIMALTPTPYSFPVSENKEVIKQRYYSYDEEKALRQDITDHMVVIKSIKPKIQKKAITVQYSLILMGVMVFLLLISIPIGLHFSTPTLIQFLSVAKP